MASLIGQTLLGQFRVDAFVASGGMGAVYRVWDLERNVPLAMKVLHADLAEDPSVYKRFEREARALRKLAHPNIVPFYGLYHTLDMTFLLERYIDGPTLKEVLRQRGGEALPIEEALVYLKAVTSALGYAHAQGVVHCDVKPGNVMVDRGGQVYLTDFGVARHAESTTTTIGYAGTAAYMAPEQVRGEAVSPATDVYGLGVMLYEMVTGRRPFRGDEAGTESGGTTAGERIRWAHLHLAPVDPRAVNPEIPEGMAGVVRKALAKVPKERWESTRDFSEAACQAAGTHPEAIRDRVELGAVEGQALEPRATTTLPAPAQRRVSPDWLVGHAGVAALAVGATVIVVLAGVLLGRRGTESGAISEPEGGSDGVVATASPSVIPRTVAASPTLRSLDASPTRPRSSTVTPGGQALPTTIAIEPLPGSGTTRVTSGSIDFFTPALSADQRRMVAFSQIEGHWQIVEIDPVGGGMVRQITAGSSDYYHPRFSADGDFILVSSNRAGPFSVYLIRFDTGEVVEQLTDGPGSSMTPCWLPGEQSFVYMSNRDGDYEIYQGYRDGSASRRLTNNSVYDGSSSVAIEGAAVAFYSVRSGNPDIYLTDLTTGETERLTDSPARDAEPASSPDGEWIAFESNRSGNYDIWAVNLRSGGLYQVTSDPPNEQMPVFSPDGQWLFYASDADGTYDIFRIPWTSPIGN